MRIKKTNKQKLATVIYQKIFEIIYDNLEGIQDNNFKVRPGYGYDKFYLNKVDGDYDCSLQCLIHYILYEDLIYRDILSTNQYTKCCLVIKNQPYSIYYPEGNSKEDIEVRELLDYIYNYTIFSIGHFMIGIGLDVRYDFRDYLDLFEHGN